jgi:hypothetical protein
MGIDVKAFPEAVCGAKAKPLEPVCMSFPFLYRILSSFPSKRLQFASGKISSTYSSNAPVCPKQKTKAQNESIKQALLQDVYKGKS